MLNYIYDQNLHKDEKFIESYSKELSKVIDVYKTYDALLEIVREEYISYVKQYIGYHTKKKEEEIDRLHQ